jgi:NADH-quinone oxidoreductase subunit L
MVAAAGLGAYGAAMFHLVTHAFFKALLFLGSGVVIHAMEHGHHHVAHAHGHDAHGEEGHHEEEAFDPQDMRNMGGLRHTMPRTYRAYLIGTLALAGIFPFAGFWSKDEILADALNAGFLGGKLEGYIAFGLLFVAALFTAFYMGRQLWMVFFGEPRTEAAKYTGERDFGYPVMVRVLEVLAVGSILIGLITSPAASGFSTPSCRLMPSRTSWRTRSSTPTLAAPRCCWPSSRWRGDRHAAPGALHLRRHPVVDKVKDPLEVREQTAGIFAYSNAKMYWDETYFRFLEGPFNRAALWLADKLDGTFMHDFVHETLLRDAYNGATRVLTDPVDLGLIDGAVNGVGRLVRWVAGGIRRLQTGYVACTH